VNTMALTFSTYAMSSILITGFSGDFRDSLKKFSWYHLSHTSTCSQNNRSGRGQCVYDQNSVLSYDDFLGDLEELLIGKIQC